VNCSFHTAGRDAARPWTSPVVSGGVNWLLAGEYQFGTVVLMMSLCSLLSSSSAAWRSRRTQCTFRSPRTDLTWRSSSYWRQSPSSSLSTHLYHASHTSPPW